MGGKSKNIRTAVCTTMYRERALMKLPTLFTSTQQPTSTPVKKRRDVEASSESTSLISSRIWTATKTCRGLAFRLPCPDEPAAGTALSVLCPLAGVEMDSRISQWCLSEELSDHSGRLWMGRCAGEADHLVDAMGRRFPGAGFSCFCTD